MTDEMNRAERLRKRQMISSVLGVIAGILFTVNGFNLFRPDRGSDFWNKPYITVGVLLILVHGYMLLSRLKKSGKTPDRK